MHGSASYAGSFEPHGGLKHCKDGWNDIRFSFIPGEMGDDMQHVCGPCGARFVQDAVPRGGPTHIFLHALCPGPVPRGVYTARGGTSPPCDCPDPVARPNTTVLCILSAGFVTWFIVRSVCPSILPLAAAHARRRGPALRGVPCGRPGAHLPPLLRPRVADLPGGHRVCVPDQVACGGASP